VTTIEGETYRDEDWYGEDLADRSYQGCEFHAVDLTEATSRGAVFTECVFGNVRLNNSRHLDSAFLRCRFLRCNLFEAEFAGCKLVGSTFTDCTLRPLKVEGGDWSFVGLPSADLRNTIFTGVRMREADLAKANCQDAALTGLDLSGAHLEGARFRGCDLRGSDLTALDPLTASVSGAIIAAEQAVIIAHALGLDVR
jgi:uncharacterized protein YjbI with pentapeptide repeats